MSYEIRFVQPDDAGNIHRMLCSRPVLLGTMRLPYGPLEKTVERIAVENGVFKLVALDEGAVVGFCELITYPDNPRHRHVGEINLIIVREEWENKGVGRAMMAAMIDLADNWLNLRRLGLIVFTGNEWAMRLYRNFGFEIEGTMPDFVFTEGVYVDAHVMGRLRR